MRAWINLYSYPNNKQSLVLRTLGKGKKGKKERMDGMDACGVEIYGNAKGQGPLSVNT